MIIIDCLSRFKQDTSDHHKIIPVSFNIQEALTKYYSIHETKQERHLVQTRSQTKTNDTVFLKEHGIDKGVDPNLKPEIQQ